MASHSSAPPPRVTVDSLPEEVLRDIMLIDAYKLSDWIGYTAPAEFHDNDPADGDLYDVEKKVNISQVSRRWRRVALQNSHLWARFRVGIGPQNYSAMIDALLERSGVAPLDVILFMGGPEDPHSGWYMHPPELYEHIVDALALHAARIRSLRVKTRGTVELLDPLLNAGLDFPALRELRIARDFEVQGFSWGDDEEENSRMPLKMTMNAPVLEILDLARVYPVSVDETLLHDRLTTVSFVGDLDFDYSYSGDESDDSTDDSKSFTLPDDSLALMAMVFAACPAIRDFTLRYDRDGEPSIEPVQGVLRPFPLSSLQSLFLQLPNDDLITVLENLTHVFIPDIRVIASDPIEFDLESDDGHPLLTHLLRGMGPIVAFDIWSFYTVTLRDARGNRRTMGTTETYVEYTKPDDTASRWKHAALWEFLSRRQEIENNVRSVTVNNRSWLAWANILDSVELAIEELHIVDGAWEFIGDDYNGDDPDRDMMGYELLEREDQWLEMQALHFASLQRVVVVNKFPRSGSGRVSIEYMLSCYVDCKSGDTKPIPVCYCDAVVVPDNRPAHKRGVDPEWTFCDRTCHHLKPPACS
ncbi:hypothetical protein AURDEDRAFT_170467 [Auricularia subglabra TFB-10046 SS5]|nr:hypothetical protein AURDEDRAFT_170467 [Auricularia subglabra TFB-10046 SS5]